MFCLISYVFSGVSCQATCKGFRIRPIASIVRENAKGLSHIYPLSLCLCTYVPMAKEIYAHSNAVDSRELNLIDVFPNTKRTAYYHKQRPQSKQLIIQNMGRFRYTRTGALNHFLNSFCCQIIHTDLLDAAINSALPRLPEPSLARNGRRGCKLIANIFSLLR